MGGNKKQQQKASRERYKKTGTILDPGKYVRNGSGQGSLCRGQSIWGMSRGTPKECPGGQAGLVRIKAECRGGVRHEAGMMSETQVWSVR